MRNCTCQSCGMPIRSNDLYGTGPNGIPIEDYCVYCYKDGEFTNDVTMDEMIGLCLRYVNGNSRDVAAVNMKMQYPRLKRWARKEKTQHEYHKSINRVLDYIQEHLGDETDLKTLAGIAHISPFHFHRIFKTTIGESLAEYVQRLRLEYVAEQLMNSGLSLHELAERTGYSSEQALSRAFKKYFSLPPKVFKASFYKDKFSDQLTPRICKVTAKSVLKLREAKPNEKSWQKLYMYALVNRLLTETTESIEIIGKKSFIPCLIIKEKATANEHIDSDTLPESLYAIFTHKGPYEGVKELYRAVINYWLGSSKYTLTERAIPYVIYISNPSTTAEQDLITEIYIPVVKRINKNI